MWLCTYKMHECDEIRGSCVRYMRGASQFSADWISNLLQQLIACVTHRSSAHRRARQLKACRAIWSFPFITHSRLEFPASHTQTHRHILSTFTFRCVGNDVRFLLFRSRSFCARPPKLGSKRTNETKPFFALKLKMKNVFVVRFYLPCVTVADRRPMSAAPYETKWNFWNGFYLFRTHAHTRMHPMRTHRRTMDCTRLFAM